jgi:hypothetical protein
MMRKRIKTRKPTIQKHHDGDLLAEAIIIGRKPYFAVAAPKVGNPDQVSITLQDSIQVDETTILKPPEITSYINKPYMAYPSTRPDPCCDYRLWSSTAPG